MTTRSTLRKLLHKLEHEEIFDILHDREDVTDQMIAKTIRAMFMRNPFDGEVEKIKVLLVKGNEK